MNASTAKEAATRLLATANMGTWSLEALTVWLECDCRCVYCDRQMLQDREVAYFFWQCDHILPRGKYPQLTSAPSNWVLSCRSCNTMKRDWDPNSDSMIKVEATRNQLTSEERSHLIAKTRERLKELKPGNEAQFAIEKEAIERCLKLKG